MYHSSCVEDVLEFAENLQMYIIKSKLFKLRVKTLTHCA